LQNRKNGRGPGTARSDGSGVAFDTTVEVQMLFSAVTRLFFVLLAGIMLTGCDLAQGIFKAGMGVGIFLVIAVLAFVVFLVTKVRRNV
jgi:hypothetical protein